MVPGCHTVPIYKSPVLQSKVALYVFDPAVDQIM